MAKQSILDVLEGSEYAFASDIKSPDFLDVTFNLETESFKQFRKANNDPKCIDIDSNHPPQILRELPKSINKRLSENSPSKKMFGKSLNEI